MSNRELAAEVGVTEGTIRNMLLYKRAADLCADRDDAPDEDAIAALGIREVRALIAQLEGGEDDEDAAPAVPPKPADAEPADLRKLKRAWDKASEDERVTFIAWTGYAAPKPEQSRNGYVPEGVSPQDGLGGAAMTIAKDHALGVLIHERICGHMLRGRLKPAEVKKLGAALRKLGQDVGSGALVLGEAWYQDKRAPQPAKVDTDASAKLPYGIDGKDLAALCIATGTTIKAFAERLHYTPQALSRLLNGNAAVPGNDDVRRAVDRLLAQSPPSTARNDYATKSKGRKPAPPKVRIPELEALIQRGQTIASIAAALGLHPTTPKLWRAGQRIPSPVHLEALRAHAAVMLS